jgi:hypothetical protein
MLDIHDRLLAGFALMPACVPAETPDADLIGLCDRLLENQARDRLLCSTWRAPGCPGDDPVIGPQLDQLDAEYEAIIGQLDTMTPASVAGVRALARVALALANMGEDRERVLRPALDWLAGSDDAGSAWTPPMHRGAPAMKEGLV